MHMMHGYIQASTHSKYLHLCTELEPCGTARGADCLGFAQACKAVCELLEEDVGECRAGWGVIHFRNAADAAAAFPR